MAEETVAQTPEATPEGVTLTIRVIPDSTGIALIDFSTSLPESVPCPLQVIALAKAFLEQQIDTATVLGAMEQYGAVLLARRQAEEQQAAQQARTGLLVPQMQPVPNRAQRRQGI